MYLQAATIFLCVLCTFGQRNELDTDSNNVMMNLTHCVQSYNATAQQLEAINAEAKLVEEKVHCVTACIMKLRGTVSYEMNYNNAVVKMVRRDDYEIFRKLLSKSSGDFFDCNEKMTQKGRLNQKGLIHKNFEEFSDSSNFQSAINLCAKHKSDDDCKTAKLLFDCLKQRIECPKRHDCVFDILFAEIVY